MKYFQTHLDTELNFDKGLLNGKKTNWWQISALISVGLAFILIYLWSRMHSYEVQTSQLIHETAVNEYLEDNWLHTPEALSVNELTALVKIKTGIFIQSLEFFNSSDVGVTGYIWQHYEDGVHDTYKPQNGEVGFILPEQVNSGSDIQPQEMYRIRDGDSEVIGWYFEATLRQPFEYDNYPFDHKTVWVRM